LPRRKIHCEFTKRRYRVTGESLHKWIDKPWRKLGIKHRMLRHDYEDWIPQRFVDEYGLPLAKSILRSHIWLDENWSWYKYEFYRKR
jgi:hypothetical protein